MFAQISTRSGSVPAVSLRSLSICCRGFPAARNTSSFVSTMHNITEWSESFTQCISYHLPYIRDMYSLWLGLLLHRNAKNRPLARPSTQNVVTRIGPVHLELQHLAHNPYFSNVGSSLLIITIIYITNFYTTYKNIFWKENPNGKMSVKQHNLVVVFMMQLNYSIQIKVTGRKIPLLKQQ